MRHQAAAAEVLRRLTSRNLLQPKGIAEVNALIDSEDFIEAARCCKLSLNQQVFGWNKFWDGGTLFGWFGEVVSAEPLRLVALEIAANEMAAEEIRKNLHERWKGNRSGDPSPDAARLLAELGVVPNAGKLQSSELNLLRRLNLDRRELPFIERWRWSGKSGYATLSDEGRLQIKPELVWTRCLEASLDDTLRLPSELIDSVNSADSDSTFLPLVYLASAETLIEKLAFFGFGERWVGGINLLSPLGPITKQLVKVLA